MTKLDQTLINQLTRDFIGGGRLFDSFMRPDASAFPPYNIIETSTGYMIELATAGFDKSEITITNEDNRLTIVGSKKQEETPVKFCYCGIAARKFERKFTLRDNIVIKSADYNNGILSIRLDEIVPEKAKTKLISIS